MQSCLRGWVRYRLCVLLVLVGSCVSWCDSRDLLARGRACAKAGEHGAAERLYGQALKEAETSQERYVAISAAYQLLRSQKQDDLAERHVLRCLDEEELQPCHVRMLLNALAGRLLWGNRYHRALWLLAQARNFDCPPSNSAYFVTYWYLSLLFMNRLKLPEPVVSLMFEPLSRTELHSSNRYTGEMLLGGAYEQLGIKDEALVHYRLALEAGGSFKLLASETMLFVQAPLAEPMIGKSRTDPRHASGSEHVWKDNCIELFLHAGKSGRFWHLMVNDNNAWSSQTNVKVIRCRLPMPGAQVRSRRTAEGWRADIAMPLKTLETDGTDLRFNLCWERNVGTRKTEFSTWSPLAMLGNWHRLRHVRQPDH